MSEGNLVLRKCYDNGRWHIVTMTAWDVEETVEELQPFIEFERSDAGQFQFGCVYGEMDCRCTERDGKPAVEFSWEGRNEDEDKCRDRLLGLRLAATLYPAVRTASRTK